MKETHTDFPNALQAFFLTLAAYFLPTLAFMLLHDMHLLAGLSGFESGTLAFTLGNGILLSVVAHYKNLQLRHVVHASGITPGTTIAVTLLPLLSIAPGLFLLLHCIWFVWDVAFPISSEMESAMKQVQGSGIGVLVSTCVLLPLVRQMLFGGIILRSFLLQYRRWPAILGSSLLLSFSVLGHPAFSIIMFVLGVISAYLYACTRSLLPGIILQVAYNGLYFLVISKTGIKPHLFLEQVPAALWLVVALMAGVGTHWLHRNLKLHFKQV